MTAVASRAVGRVEAKRPAWTFGAVRRAVSGVGAYVAGLEPERITTAQATELFAELTRLGSAAQVLLEPLETPLAQSDITDKKEAVLRLKTELPRIKLFRTGAFTPYRRILRRRICTSPTRKPRSTTQARSISTQKR